MSSLYFHIPFCRRRCRYCDFFSTTTSDVERDNYVDLLCRHLELIHCDELADSELQTIYFGGGTPSLLTAEQLHLLLTASRARFGLSAEAEITLEVNPGTFGGKYLQQVRQTGINRLSIGIQSFNDQQLRQLGRCHNADQARAAVTGARAAGFDNISLDLMFALPGQDTDDLDREIDQLLQQEPEHISVYGLTVEAGTEFERWQQQGLITAVDEDEYARQYELLRARFSAAGYEHYEVSNFARPGWHCQHNQRYWQRRSCLAIGAGAHSFVESGYGERRHVPADLARYRQLLTAGVDPAERLESFNRRGAMIETLYLALRTSAGVDPVAFEERFGESLQRAFPTAMARLQASLVCSGERIMLPPQHWLIYDHLIKAFF
ncbi:MAG: radical SAM family heme chaperone HemW [Desulfuromonadales bacterium]|nr:radical SAM family heme chaperone HemW [Desulfuromonadales bacterium]